LSPAFDINPSPERVREFKTWISDDAGPAMTIDALMSVIAYFRITRVRAREILSEVEHAVDS
jgi:serine/threonine-protein kinase HipA